MVLTFRLRAPRCSGFVLFFLFVQRLHIRSGHFVSACVHRIKNNFEQLQVQFLLGYEISWFTWQTRSKRSILHLQYTSYTSSYHTVHTISLFGLEASIISSYEMCVRHLNSNYCNQNNDLWPRSITVELTSCRWQNSSRYTQYGPCYALRLRPRRMQIPPFYLLRIEKFGHFPPQSETR